VTSAARRLTVYDHQGDHARCVVVQFLFCHLLMSFAADSSQLHGCVGECEFAGVSLRLLVPIVLDSAGRVCRSASNWVMLTKAYSISFFLIVPVCLAVWFIMCLVWFVEPHHIAGRCTN